MRLVGAFVVTRAQPNDAPAAEVIGRKGIWRSKLALEVCTCWCQDTCPLRLRWQLKPRLASIAGDVQLLLYVRKSLGRLHVYQALKKRLGYPSAVYCCASWRLRLLGSSIARQVHWDST
jgi:hypothetical protein